MHDDDENVKAVQCFFFQRAETPPFGEAISIDSDGRS